MTDELDDVDENERAEAAALAAALDGQAASSAREAPEDALATALLMRHGGARGELSAERSEAILNELLRDAQRGQTTTQTAVPAGRKAKVVRLLPWGAALAVAAALMLVWMGPWLRPTTQTVASTPAVAAELAGAHALPQVSVELLSAQSALLRESLEHDPAGSAGAGAGAKTSAAAQRFERELRGYRAQLFRALQARYPVKVGLLDRSRASSRRSR